MYELIFYGLNSVKLKCVNEKYILEHKILL